MPDTVRTVATLQSMLSDGAAAHSTNRQLIRDLLVSLDSIAAGYATVAVEAVQKYPILGSETAVTDKTFPYGDVRRHGATGDGTTDDKTSVQNAITTCNTLRLPLLVPAPAVYHKIVGSIQLANDLTIIADNQWLGTRTGSTGNFHFVGDGTNPVFVTGAYPGGVGTNNRNITLVGISARNNGAEVIDLYTAQNWKLIRCALASYSFADAAKGTVNARMSYRGTMQDCNIVASGGAWAVSAYDNCNGLNAQNNIITGGSLGGAVDIGQSQNIRFNGTIIEQSLKGFRVGATGVTGAGICNSVNLNDNYLEEVGSPYEIGTGFIVRGLSIQRGYIGNTSLSLTESPYFVLGRVQGWKIGGGIAILRKTGGTAEVFEFQYNASAPNYATAGEATDVYYTGGTGAWNKALTGWPSTDFIGRLTGQNRLQPVLSGAISGVRTYESQPITANVGRVSTGVFPLSTYGGEVQSIEIFEATGTLGCTVDVGSTASATEIASFDPSALTITNGSGTATIAAVLIRPARAVLFRVTAGAGTGSFRVRITVRML